MNIWPWCHLSWPSWNITQEFCTFQPFAQDDMTSSTCVDPRGQDPAPGWRTWHGSIRAGQSSDSWQDMWWRWSKRECFIFILVFYVISCFLSCFLWILLNLPMRRSGRKNIHRQSSYKSRHSARKRFCACPWEYLQINMRKHRKRECYFFFIALTCINLYLLFPLGNENNDWRTDERADARNLTNNKSLQNCMVCGLFAVIRVWCVLLSSGFVACRAYFSGVIPLPVGSIEENADPVDLAETNQLKFLQAWHILLWRLSWRAFPQEAERTRNTFSLITGIREDTEYHKKSYLCKDETSRIIIPVRKYDQGGNHHVQRIKGQRVSG